MNVKRFIVLMLILIFAFSGCSAMPENESTTGIDTEVTASDMGENDTDDFFTGAWISYIELKKLGRSEEEYEKYVESLFQNLKEVGTTDVFVHVRAFGDAL